MSIFKIFLKTVYIIAITLILVELTLSFLARNSYKYKQLTINPYRDVNISKVNSWDEFLYVHPHTLKPGMFMNGIKVNSRGLLSDEISYEHPDSEYRILHLGDSFAVGIVPYNDHFISLLDNYLKSDIKSYLGKDIKSINMGIPGVGTYSELLALKLEGVKYKPDLIILSFFVGNDFFEDKENLTEVNRPKSASVPVGHLKRLLFDLKGVSFLRNLYIIRNSVNLNDTPQNNFYNFNEASFQDFIEGMATPTFSENEYQQLLKDRSDIYLKNMSGFRQFDEISKDILEIKKISNEINSDFLVTIIPDEVQINPELFDNLIRSLELDGDLVDVNLPQKVLTQFLDKESIKYVDLLPKFLSEANPAGFYKPRDTHWNFIGNQKAAEILYRELVNLDYIGLKPIEEK